MADQPTEEEVNQIADALAGGRKIEAIKIYRQATGKGLKEAKDFIEELIPRLKEQDPEKYAGLSDKKVTGCGSAVLMLIGFAVGSAWLFELLS